jgi:hypothetical protein
MEYAFTEENSPDAEVEDSDVFCLSVQLRNERVLVNK